VKKFTPWAILFVGCLAFAILVDHGVKHIGIPDYIWLSINLTTFLYVLNRFVGVPMSSFLDTRQVEIGQELKDAESKIVEAEELRVKVMQRLDEVETEVKEIKEKAEVQGLAEIERLTEQTMKEEERFLRRVDEEINRRQKETRKMLAEETTALTAQLATGLLEREMTDTDRKNVLDRSMVALKAIEK
jgi:F0F1-type ATP synthase membrane subunit b/b'